MEGASWADQWDYGNPDPVPTKGGAVTKTTTGAPSTTAKYKQKLGQGFEKTKVAASTGYKKAKHGTSLGIQWVKEKYQKHTQKH